MCQIKTIFVGYFTKTFAISYLTSREQMLIIYETIPPFLQNFIKLHVRFSWKDIFDFKL